MVCVSLTIKCANAIWGISYRSDPAVKPRKDVLPVRGTMLIQGWSLPSDWVSWAETCRPAVPPASSELQSSEQLKNKHSNS